MTEEGKNIGGVSEEDTQVTSEGVKEGVNEVVEKGVEKGVNEGVKEGVNPGEEPEEAAEYSQPSVQRATSAAEEAARPTGPESREERLARLKRLVAVLPESPGCYQYLDGRGTIIYVGKAVNLRRRVSQYFNGQQTPKTAILVSRINDIRHICVATETDALLLENTLIKRHKPRYNILLKDDKTYPWIAILREPYPRVVVTRQHVRGQAEYFGPYTSGGQMKELMDLVRECYPLRQCRKDLSPAAIAKGNYAVCLKYHLGLCQGPCCGHVTEEEYQKHIDGVREVLRGRIAPIVKALKTQMLAASEAQEYELAERYKRRWERLERYQAHSLVAGEVSVSCEVFAVRDNEARGESYVNRLTVEQGRVVQSVTHVFKRAVEGTTADVLQFAISCARDEPGGFLTEVVLAEELSPVPPGIKITVPTFGIKRQLLALSERNARQYELECIQHRADRTEATAPERRLALLQELLHLPALPRHIECFDNSHTGGMLPVASCIVYRDGHKAPGEYRLFNIRQGQGADDYASMREVVARRYSRLLREGKPLPDLVVADGGSGQMKVIREAAHDIGVTLNVIGLAKDTRHTTNQILVGDPPVVVGLPRSDYAFRFFAQMQLEVHRVAVSFHRHQRSRYMISSLLDEVPGIGPKSKVALLERFGDVEHVRQAAVEEVAAVVGKLRAARLMEWFEQQHYATSAGDTAYKPDE